MAKQTNDIVLTCPDCGGERFQWHERGRIMLNPDSGETNFTLEEVACACLDCHHVSVEAELVKLALPKG